MVGDLLTYEEILSEYGVDLRERRWRWQRARHPDAVWEDHVAGSASRPVVGLDSQLWCYPGGKHEPPCLPRTVVEDVLARRHISDSIERERRGGGVLGGSP